MRVFRSIKAFSAILFAGMFALCAASAHEARPGYLELREAAPGHYNVMWKQPAVGDYALRMSPAFPAGCEISGVDDRQLLPGALVSRFTLACHGSLDGKEITIAGLEMTLTDVLVRVYKLDGTEETHLAEPSAPAVKIGGGGGIWPRSATYLELGIRHILMGADHLLFVLGLLLIVPNRWALLKTVTAFTVAHSLSLAAATLGWTNVPAAPLNAAIALSILFLGPEIVRARTGGTSLTLRRPWLVAFAFGLLHGFGFASGLAAMGLPRGEIPLALLMFNGGVEIGQIAFVGLILGLELAFRILEIRWPKPVTLMPGYVVGTLGGLWTLQRLVIFLGIAP